MDCYLYVDDAVLNDDWYGAHGSDDPDYNDKFDGSVEAGTGC